MRTRISPASPPGPDADEQTGYNSACGLHGSPVSPCLLGALEQPVRVGFVLCVRRLALRALIKFFLCRNLCCRSDPFLTRPAFSYFFISLITASEIGLIEPIIK